MCAAAARVHWQTPPADWLLPAAVVFFMAVRQCQPFESDNAGEDAVVIQVKVVRQSQVLSRVKEEIPSNVDVPLVELVPEPMVYLVPSQTVLDTTIGKWLSEHHLLNKTLCALVGICVLLLVLDLL